MKNQRKEVTLSTNQWVWLVFAALPVGITTLSRVINQYAKQTGWLFIFLMAVLVIVFARFYVILLARYPRQSLVAISRQILGKVMGTIFSLGILFNFIGGAGLSIRLLSEGTSTYLLFHTPQAVIMLAMLLVVLYASSKGIETIAKINEILQPISLTVILFILLLVIGQADFTNLLPLISEQISIVPLLSTLTYPFTVLLFVPFLFPYAGQARQFWKGLVWGITLIAIVIITNYIYAIAIFGTSELNFTEYPTIDMARIIDFPLWERMEILYMINWIPIGFTVQLLLAYVGSLGLNQCFPGRPFFFWLIIVLALAFLVGILPENVEQTRLSAIYLNTVFGFYHFVGFPFLVMLDSLRKRRRSRATDS